jgi:hypothetical protein
VNVLVHHECKGARTPYYQQEVHYAVQEVKVVIEVYGTRQSSKKVQKNMRNEHDVSLMPRGPSDAKKEYKKSKLCKS